MSDSVEINEMIEKIDVEKQLLSLMPKNNEKNIGLYKEKVEEIEKEHLEFQKQIEKTLNKRYQKGLKFEPNTKIENLNIRINTIEKMLFLISEEKTSYEKMKLDKIIYKIGRYYKGNLEDINRQIYHAIKEFHNIGINLELSDFNYSSFVSNYMKVFFEEKKKGKINTTRLKEKFEELYWKCPDLIIHIELNLRNIYLQKETKIDKLFEKEKNNLLKQWEKSSKEIIKTYLEIMLQKNEEIDKDPKIILNNFLNETLNIDDYTQEKVNEYYSKILPKENLDMIETNREELEKGVIGFLNSLKEYKNYIDFKFIIDDIKKQYNDKDKNKKMYDETKKQILSSEAKLKKINKKLMRKRFFAKDKTIKQSVEQNQMILEIKKQYKELDKNKFLNKISTILNNDSTIYETLNLANSYYNYLANCMIENNKTITQEKIDEQINRLDEFLKNPNNNIITNMTLLDDKDIAMIIKDKFKLMNFNIKQEDFEKKKIDSLISILEKIVTSINIKKSGLSEKNIREMVDIKLALDM